MSWNEIREDARILIVESDEVQLHNLQQMFRMARYEHVYCAVDAGEAEAAVLGFKPDVILMDLEMPGQDAYEIMQRLQARAAADEYLPVIALVDGSEPAFRVKPLLGGARDSVQKPVDQLELMVRVRLQLEVRFLTKRLAGVPPSPGRDPIIREPILAIVR